MSRASGLMNDDTEIDGWSISRWPTPGTLAHHLDAEIAQIGRPGRCPARNRCAGEWIAPDETMTSPRLATRNSVSLPATSALTPTQRVPSNSSRWTWVSAEIVRLSRSRVPGSR